MYKPLRSSQDFGSWDPCIVLEAGQRPGLWLRCTCPDFPPRMKGHAELPCLIASHIPCRDAISFMCGEIGANSERFGAEGRANWRLSTKSPRNGKELRCCRSKTSNV